MMICFCFSKLSFNFFDHSLLYGEYIAPVSGCKETLIARSICRPGRIHVLLLVSC